MNKTQESMAILKSAVMTHMLYYAGATGKLAERLLKLIDLIEDQDEDRRYVETTDLANLLVGDILREELEWLKSHEPTNTYVQQILTALESTTMTAQERLSLVGTLAQNKLLKLGTDQGV
jgi:hypothetical protein